MRADQWPLSCHSNDPEQTALCWPIASLNPVDKTSISLDARLAALGRRHRRRGNGPSGIYAGQLRLERVRSDPYHPTTHRRQSGLGPA